MRRNEVVDPNIQIVAEACKEDEELRKVVQAIARMNREQREEFKQKVNEYFFNRVSPEDVEAWKFYKYILEGNRARTIMSILEEEKDGA